MTMRIDVTQEDIDKGVKKCHCTCPIALALKRQTRVAYEVSDDCVVAVTDRFAHGLPEHASSFIRAFDMGLIVAPFSFELDIPEAPAPGGHPAE